MTLGREIIIDGDLIMVEVLQGFYSDRDFRKAKELLSNFQFMEMPGQELAVKSAENYRFLRRKGVTVHKAIDVIIGTFCIHHNISLLHDDQDFAPLTNHLKLKAVKCA